MTNSNPLRSKCKPSKLDTIRYFFVDKTNGLESKHNAMKRLVFIIDNLSGGGAERVVLTLADTLNKIGHEGIIVTLSEGIEHEVPSGVRIVKAYELAPRRLFKNIGRLKRHGKALQEQLQLLDSETPIDLLISNLPRTDRIVKHTQGYNRTFCIHNTYSVEYLAKKKGISRWRKYRQLKQVYHNEALIAVSDGVFSDIQDILALSVKSLHKIYNPFQPELIKALAEEPTATDYGDYIIHVGRINRQKRHDRLLRAYKASNISGRAKLLLLGNGTEAEVKQLVSSIDNLGLTDNVVLHDFVKNPFPYIKQAKALVLSSDFEGFGNVLVEALICATPVISTDCPSGPNEILTGDLAQYLVPTEDEEALARKIEEVYSNPPQISESSYENFSAELIARQYLELV